MVLQYMRCAPTWHVMNMWITHRYSRVHMKSPKFKCSKYEVCGVKIYAIQLHLKMSNLTFIPLGFKVLRELMSLCSATWLSKSLLPLVLRMPVTETWFREWSGWLKWAATGRPAKLSRMDLKWSENLTERGVLVSPM